VQARIASAYAYFVLPGLSPPTRGGVREDGLPSDKQGPAEDPPNAKGMSGSLLWDTKFVACANQRISWGRHLAKVCGLIRTAYRDPKSLVLLVWSICFRQFWTEFGMSELSSTGSTVESRSGMRE
jgi:hypothetical protein